MFPAAPVGTPFPGEAEGYPDDGRSTGTRAPLGDWAELGGAGCWPAAPSLTEFKAAVFRPQSPCVPVSPSPGLADDGVGPNLPRIILFPGLSPLNRRGNGGTGRTSPQIHTFRGGRQGCTGQWDARAHVPTTLSMASAPRGGPRGARCLLWEDLHLQPVPLTLAL